MRFLFDSSTALRRGLLSSILYQSILLIANNMNFLFSFLEKVSNFSLCLDHKFYPINDGVKMHFKESNGAMGS